MALKWEDGGCLLTARGDSGYDYDVWLDSCVLVAAPLEPTYHGTVGHAKARAEHLEAERMRAKQGDRT